MGYKLGSLFDGSGGFPLSGALCGIEPCWAAEVEPYPIAVTRTRFPNMKHLGDISKVNGAEIEPVDIITFGSPCQDLSVAGKRAGLKHEANGDEETTRSGLFMEAVRIIKEMREATNGIYPRYALWENVPGAFSSNKGEDFRIVCEELIKIVEPSASMPTVPQNGWNYADSYCGDGWSLAYRVFDAQYWGVPQRRRRIHLIADFRGTSAREVLFEREGLRGYFAEGRTPWKAAPADAQDCPGATDREGESQGGAGERGLDAVGFMRQLSGVETQQELSPTLLAAMGESGNNKPCVAYTLKIRGGVAVDSGGKAAGKGALVQTDLSATLGCNQDQYLFQPTAIIDNIGGQAEYGKVSPVNGTLRAGAQGAIAYAVENHPADSRVNLDESGKVQTLTSRMGTGGGNVPMVLEGQPAYGLDRASFNQGENAKYDFSILEEQMPTLLARGPGATAYGTDVGWLNSAENQSPTLLARGYKDPHLVTYSEGAIHYIVRRLTPTECARLQGFADRWGDIEVKDSFTDEEYSFWLEVRSTHARINGKAEKNYTKPQMLTWYNKLQTDAAEYKMWGNGIALPPALYCMQGIVDALNAEEDDSWIL